MLFTIAFVKALAIHFQVRYVIFCVGSISDHNITTFVNAHNQLINVVYFDKDMWDNQAIDQINYFQSIHETVLVFSMVYLEPIKSAISVLPKYAADLFPHSDLRLDSDIYTWTLIENNLIKLEEVFKVNDQIIRQNIGTFSMNSGNHNIESKLKLN